MDHLDARSSEHAQRARIAAYLHFGYLPSIERGHRQLPWARVRREDVASGVRLDREELFAAGIAALRAARGVPGAGPQIVPLSGGVDSRLILGMLLEAGLRDRLVATTFGIPGSLDFDLGARVAAVAGVRHEPIDLRAFPTTRDELLETARRAPWSFVLEVHYARLVFRRHGATATYWSGNQANSLAGEDACDVDGSWPDACRRWALATTAVRSVRLAPPGFRPESALPVRPPVADSCLNHVEQLFLFVRNHGRNDPAQLLPGFDVRVPFRQPEWVDFVLRLPPAIRDDGRFYRELAARWHPELFSLPLKNCLGLPLAAPAWRYQLRRARLKAERSLKARFPRLAWRADPKTNYVDYDAELRGPTSIARIVEDSVQRLAAHEGIDWMDPRRLWEHHRSRRANHGEALALLASLELNLAANGSPPLDDSTGL